MEKTINQIKAAIAASVGLLTGLWGWIGWLVVGSEKTQTDFPQKPQIERKENHA